MTKAPELTSITTGFNSATTLNANLSAIEAAFENTVSLDGSTPNAMQADLDLNGNDLLNVGDLFIGGERVTGFATVPNWESEWATATSYAVNDLVREDGNVYIALVAHTSGTFATDFSASKWELFASKGSSGDGTGDLLSTNNLSDVTDAATARSNLGLGSSATLASVDEDNMASDSDTLLPTQQSVKAYVDTEVPTVLDEDDMVSDSNTAVPSQQSVKAYVDNSISSSVLTSSQNTISNAGTFTFTHNLNTRDLSVDFFLVCINPEYGWVAGDYMSVHTDPGTAFGFSSKMGLNTVVVKYAAQPQPFSTIRQDTGASAFLTNANWRMIVRVSSF